MKPVLWILIAVVLLVVVVLPRLRGAKASPEVVRQKLSRGAAVIDVRSPGEFTGGAYPGAVNIPVQEIAQRANEIPRDRPVVLYCASGMRSGMAAARLRKAGFTDVVNAGSLRDLPR